MPDAITTADIWTTMRRYHAACVRVGDVNHALAFDHCPEARCRAFRDAMEGR